MGIPSYFSHIIKNYPNVLIKFEKLFIVNNLFLDSNSIIYDCIRDIKYNNNNNDYEKKLINAVCKKIEDYIQQISPNNLVYISFDGVAPVAKLNQQKNRRYKSWFINNYDSSSDSKIYWDSTAITPGTDFMNKLNLQLKYHFRSHIPYKVKKIIISGSDEPGEGEHKIFEYIRINHEKIKDEKCVIYGLDADLIMLSINHLNLINNMYLFRETPDFIKSIDNSLDPNLLYIIDIPVFKDNLVYYLNYDKIPEEEYEKNRVYDYIFLCFLLGNDFLPHFPALNIRTNGIDIILETYRNILGKGKKNIINSNKEIQWKNFKLLINELANNEEEYIITEHRKRNKLEKNKIKFNEKESKFDKEMLHIPIKERFVEKYINPLDKYWESRYYDMLFDIDTIDDLKKKEISLNYLEGLEWTWYYYSSDCLDWRWKYNYHYPPLLCDLVKYIPYFDTRLIETKNKNPVKEYIQLSYVLPKQSLYLLPRKIEFELLSKLNKNYQTNYEFKWAYCKYFWECHVDFPNITIEDLEKILDN